MAIGDAHVGGRAGSGAVMHEHALIIGKFYPPHAGHHVLIRAAAAAARRVTVVVMASMEESLQLADRVAWMSAEHAVDPNVVVTGIRCDAPMDYGSDVVWAAQVACMRAAVSRVTRVPIDTVFSGEKYGDELARRFDAVHIPVDPERVRVPISGTDCRADLPGSWDYLAAPVRAGLTTRIVVVGGESTGTTTLSRGLAYHYRSRGGVWAETAWVPEFGRQATIDKLQALDGSATMSDVTWTGADFVRIAARQNELENAAARVSSPVLICDTDAFATTVWERRYLGSDSAESVVELPPRAVYLVTDHAGVPFVQDGIRDGEHIRAEMTTWFIEALTAAGHSWVLLTGSASERLELAVNVTDQAIAARSRFTQPLSDPNY